MKTRVKFYTEQSRYSLPVYSYRLLHRNPAVITSRLHKPQPCTTPHAVCIGYFFALKCTLIFCIPFSRPCVFMLDIREFLLWCISTIYLLWLSPGFGCRRKATSAADTFHFILIVQTNFQHTNHPPIIKHCFVACMLWCGCRCRGDSAMSIYVINNSAAPSYDTNDAARWQAAASWHYLPLQDNTTDICDEKPLSTCAHY